VNQSRLRWARTVRLWLAAAGAIGLAATLSTAIAQPGNALSIANVWDLSPLFRDDSAWAEAVASLKATLPALARLEGTLGKDAASLREALDTLSAADRQLERLWVYASAQQSTDNRDRRNQERVSLAESLEGELGSSVAWVDPEIQRIGRERVEAYLKAEPGLATHSERLRRALRRAAHTLSPDTEAALAAFKPVRSASAQARTLLVDADITWPTAEVDGRKETVNDTGYEKLRQHPDRSVRKQAMDLFFGALGQYENTFGVTLGATVQAGVIEAKLRKHGSAVAASLAETEVPEVVYRTLVAEANKGLPVLHRYFKLRQRMLKLPDMHYYDIYPSLVRLERSYPVDASARLTLEAVLPLGEAYASQLRRALALRSMHVLPAAGKSGGAYQTGAFGLTPYVFLNHQDDYESLSTFAHEWGHAMHTLLTNQTQPFEKSNYPLFIAEIASTLNEVLLSERLLRTAASREERLFFLGQALERLRGTFYRQALFGEFELQMHDAVERGEALSGKRLTEMYCGLLRKYHVAEQGVMAIDPAYCQEWLFVSHFYRPFYVYQYATSISAAEFFSEHILAGAPGVREAYLDVLRSGGSVPPYELLKRAGLDMASPAPYEAVVRRMGTIIDEIERLLDAAK